MPKKGYVVRIISYFYHMMTSTSFLFSVNVNKPNILVISNSSREFESSQFLTDINSNLFSFTIGNYQKRIGVSSYFVGIIFAPVVFYNLLKLKKSERNFVKYCFDQIMLCAGLHYSFQKIINEKTTKGVFISNHVSPISRVGMKIAKSKKIKLIYLEHTQMIDAWPKIECDYFLLSGKNSLIKLLNKENQTYEKIFLIGSPKIDKLKPQNKMKNISICIGSEDNMKKIVSLINQLQIHFNKKRILVRPHPSLDRKMYKKYLKNLNVDIQHPENQSLYEFFNCSDIIITNESGIFFEAGYADKLILRYMFSEKPLKNYSTKNNLLFGYITNEKQLIDSILSFNYQSSKIRFSFKEYYDNIGTIYDGNSSLLGLSALEKIGLIKSELIYKNEIFWEKNDNDIFSVKD